MRVSILLGILLVSTATMGCTVRARGGAYAGSGSEDRNATSSGSGPLRSTTDTPRRPASPVTGNGAGNGNTGVARPAPITNTNSTGAPNGNTGVVRPQPMTSTTGTGGTVEQTGERCPPGHVWSDGKCHDRGKGHDPNKDRGNGNGKK